MDRELMVATPLTGSTRVSPDGIDLSALETFLQRHEKGALDGPLHGELISGGKSNLTYRLTDGTTKWILRRPPLGQVPRGAHDVAREHRVMAGLRGTAVPVPEMTALCQDSAVMGVPFYVMREVPGTVLRTPDMVAQLPVPVRAALGTTLVDTLADLHDVDFQAQGLAELGRPEGFLQRQLDRWIRQYRAIQVRELDHIDRIVLVLTSDVPTNREVSVVHGDYRIDNCIVEPDDHGRIAAVLDWEMATLGDPLADLGMLLVFWDEPGAPFNPVTQGLTAFEGFPRPAEVVQRYLNRRNLSADNLDWYVVFAQFKLAVILEQIYVRNLQGQTRGEGFGEIGNMVLALLEQTRETISRSSVLSAVGGS